MNFFKIIEYKSGFNSIKGIHLDAYLIWTNFPNLVNLKNSISGKLIKSTWFADIFRSVSVFYSNLGQSLSIYDPSVLEIDCIATFYLSRFTIQLNLKNDSDFIESYAEFIGKEMVSKNFRLYY